METKPIAKLPWLKRKLKGSSGTIGASQVWRVCAGIEEAGRSGRLEEAKVLLSRLEEEFQGVRSALKDFGYGKQRSRSI